MVKNASATVQLANFTLMQSLAHSLHHRYYNFDRDGLDGHL